MRRKFYDKLLRWKTRQEEYRDACRGGTAALIQGARRVGKSYIAEEFAKREYRSYILIDFNMAGQDVRDLFNEQMEDVEHFYALLQARYGTRLYERDSVIILDEVQLFPRARSCVKYLAAYGRYDVIETGSLISIKENVQDILIPSEEEQMNMYPMDFQEFLWAKYGEDSPDAYDLIRDYYERKKPLPQALHRKWMMDFREYMIVGGMPQAVQAYLPKYDFESAERQKRNIINLYRDDIHKHGNALALKIERVWDEIPTELRNQNRHFKLSALEPGARLDDYRDSLFWLSDAMTVNCCYNTYEPSLGLKMNLDHTVLKCYLADTGLLISHAFDEKGLVEQEVYRKLLFDKLEVNMGMIVENIVAQMLVTSGHKLYFYSHSAPTAPDRMEVDFLIGKKTVTNRHNVSPIEVKSSPNYTLSSIRKYITKFKEQVETAYVVHTGDYKVEDGITFLPLYMVPLL